VDAGRIGALGLSSGADGLVALSPARDRLAAVVGDGTAARSLEDVRRDRAVGLGGVPGAITFGVSRLLSGVEPGEPLEDAARRITSPVLYVSAGRGLEFRLSRRYARATPGARHWNLPQARHTGAIRSHRAAYEARVVGFLARHLGAR
jgi:hypothetical protein